MDVGAPEVGLIAAAISGVRTDGIAVDHLVIPAQAGI